jgi:hypothetical protein
MEELQYALSYSRPSSLFVVYYIFLDTPLLYSIKRLGYAIILTLVSGQVSGLGSPSVHVWLVFIVFYGFLGL